MKKCELENKTPNWFRNWRDNEFWHLAVEVRATTIIVVIIFTITVAIAVGVYLR